MEPSSAAEPVTPEPGPSGGRALRRVTLSSLIGTAVEFYDFVLYATMTALVFDRLFFSNLDPALATVAAFGAFSAGYVARPLGGIVFGHFGDRLGRKKMLILSMSLMGAASFLIGALPTYEMVGAAAPILLVVLRIVQGVALGGEWGGATLMVNEHAAAASRGLWNGIVQMGGPIGGLLSTAAVMGVTLLGDDALLSWGWRVPFLLSAVLLVVGLYIRAGVAESPVFVKAATTDAAAGAKHVPLATIMRRPGPLALACAVGIGPFALAALIGVYMISYAKAIGYELSDVILASLIGTTVALLTTPLFSAMSDRVGRRRVILGGAVGIVVYALPFYALVDSLSPARLVVALMIATAIQTAMFAPLGALLSEMFDTEVRFTGVSMGYQLAAVLGGGFTPLIASSLLAGHLHSTPLVVIAICCGVVTMLAILRIGDKSGRDLTKSGDTR